MIKSYIEYIKELSSEEILLQKFKGFPMKKEEDKEYRNKATKSLVAIRDLKSGDVLTQDSISLKRSDSLITEGSILEIEQAIGKTLTVDVKINSPIVKGFL